MSKTTPEQNKALVIEAFDTLLNKRDYDAAARAIVAALTVPCGRANAEDKLLTEAVNFTGAITYLSTKVPGFMLVAVRNGEMAFAGFGNITDNGGQDT